MRSGKACFQEKQERLKAYFREKKESLLPREEEKRVSMRIRKACFCEKKESLFPRKTRKLLKLVSKDLKQSINQSIVSTREAGKLNCFQEKQSRL